MVYVYIKDRDLRNFYRFIIYRIPSNYRVAVYPKNILFCTHHLYFTLSICLFITFSISHLIHM